MSRLVALALPLLGLLVGVAILPSTSIAADLKSGKKVFSKCKACHEISKEKNKVGPHLVGIIGRKAASVEGFKYSDAMLEKGAEGLVWNEEALAQYLADPKAFVAKTKMVFPGLKKEEQIEDVIAYLKEEAGG